MTENPFQYNSPITYTGRFAGRQDVFSFVQSNLVGGHQQHALVILGPSQIGKSSVLRMLPSRVDAHYVPIRISLRAGTVASEKEWLTALAETVPQAIEAVDIHSARLPELPAHPADLRDALKGEYMEVGLRSLRRDRHLLVLVDNAERLLTATQSRTLPRDTFKFLSELLEIHPRLDFLMAVDSQYEPDLLTVGPPFESSLIFRLGALKPEELRELLAPSDAPEGTPVIRYEPEALDAIYDLTAGRPYLAQLMGWLLFERSDERQHGSPITVEDVEAVANSALAVGGGALAAVWERATAQEQLVLTAMCALSPDEPPEPVPFDDIGAWLIAADHPLDPRTVNATWRRLEYEGVLQLSADGRLLINGGLQRRWLRDHVTLPEGQSVSLPWRRVALIMALAILVLAVVLAALSALPEQDGSPVNAGSEATITLGVDLQSTSDAYNATETATAR